MRRLILALSLLSAAPCALADLLYLNNGDEINGNLVKLSSASAVLEAAGRTAVYDRRDIMKLQFIKEYSSGKSAPLEDDAVRQLLANPPKPEDYPNDGFITWLMDVTIDINRDKSYSVTKRGLRYILRERGKSPASFVTLNYLPEFQDVAINYAYSITDSSVSYLNDISVMEGYANLSYPAYNRAKTIKFAVPNVQTGSVLDFEYTVNAQYNSTYPFFGDIAFRYMEPSKIYRLTVNVPEGLKLNHKEFNMPPERGFSTKDLAGRTAYVWEMRDVPSYKDEPDAPPFMCYAPQVMLSLEDGWQPLRAELAPLLRKRLVFSSDIAAKTEELIDGKATDLEKAEALYNWVAREIKYQPVSAANYSYVPKNAAEIFQQRAGNGLDKPFLLYAMLDAAGLKPGLAYSSDKESLFADGLANIRQFAYAEVLLDIGGRTLILCPLDDRHRYDELDDSLQGARALRVFGGADKPELFDNPLLAPELESLEAASVFSLDANGDLRGDITTRVKGESQARLRAYKNFKKDDLDKAMEQYAHSIHPQASLEGYTFENPEDLSNDTMLKLSVSVKSYALKAGKYMLFKIPGLDFSAGDVGLAERTLPLFWFARSRSEAIASITLPSGYKLHHVPQDIGIEAAGQKYAARYTQDGGALKFSGEFRRAGTEITAQEYPQYRVFKETLARFAENWVVLEKN